MSNEYEKVTSHNSRGLGTCEFGSGTDDVILFLLVGVKAREGVKNTKVGTMVRDDTHNRDSDTIAQTSNTTASSILIQTVKETIELLLPGTDIRGKMGASVIEERSSTSKTTVGHIDSEELGKLLGLVCFGEKGLNPILEGKVECLCGEVADKVCQVSMPEDPITLFLHYTEKAVNNANVACDLPADDFEVGILGLDDERAQWELCRSWPWLW